MEQRLADLIALCPKAELHYHIDCISPELYYRFSHRNHMDNAPKTLADASAFYRFSNLGEFISVMMQVIASIQTKQDIVDMVIACAEDMVSQNILYREAMFDYTGCYGKRGIPLETVIRGFEEGLQAAYNRYGRIDLRFIANLDRTAPAESNCDYLRALAAYRDRIPLVAVGLAGAEAGFPAHNQAQAFRLAHEMGLYTTAHSGEEAGAESVRDALDSLALDRIDHGIRSVEDEALMKRLASENILLTLCPDSNLCLGVYPNWEAYPLRRLLECGVKVCINSDDPPCYRYNLIGNLVETASAFRLTRGEVITLIRNSFQYNFAGQEHLPEVDRWLKEYCAHS